MDKLSFPLWMVFCRTPPHEFLPVLLAGEVGIAAVFSSPQFANEYMMGKAETNWETRMISRSTFEKLVSDLKMLGLQGMCLDPLRGDGRRQVAFDK